MGAIRWAAFVAAGCLCACSTSAPPRAKAPAAPSLAERPVATASPTAVREAPSSPPAQLEPEEDTLTTGIPTECSGAEGCFPDPAFAERVCRGKFPNLPFALFAKGTPWQRLYVKAETIEPVNAYGGPRSDAWMQFGEEVVVLRRRGNGSRGGVQISGPTDVDVLRWDGTCATIRQEMFVTYIPAEAVSPRIVWKYLEDPLRDALRKNASIAAAESMERRDCRASSPSDPSPACDKAMRRLTDAVMVAVRLGIDLPTPENVPAWRPTAATASR